jgi:FMN phosphatase YigB (HAD superfamily)
VVRPAAARRVRAGRRRRLPPVRRTRQQRAGLGQPARPVRGDRPWDRGRIAELDPHPDVEPAFRRAHDTGLQVVTLTNGSAQTTTALLRRAGVDHHVKQVLSVDDIETYKPAPAIFAPPDVAGADLTTVVDGLLALPEP